MAEVNLTVGATAAERSDLLFRTLLETAQRDTTLLRDRLARTGETEVPRREVGRGD